MRYDNWERFSSERDATTVVILQRLVPSIPCTVCNCVTSITIQKKHAVFICGFGLFGAWFRSWGMPFNLLQHHRAKGGLQQAFMSSYRIADIANCVNILHSSDSECECKLHLKRKSLSQYFLTEFLYGDITMDYSEYPFLACLPTSEPCQR